MMAADRARFDAIFFDLDGTLIDSQTTPSRTNMASSYWNNWSGFPGNQEGWFWAYLLNGYRVKVSGTVVKEKP